MSLNIFNAVIHPCQSPTILGWILWRWQLDATAKLCILVPKGEGKRTDARIRVALTELRRAVKRQGIKDYKRFGINNTPGTWTLLDGTEYDVLYISRFVSTRHVFTEIIEEIGL